MTEDAISPPAPSQKADTPREEVLRLAGLATTRPSELDKELEDHTVEELNALKDTCEQTLKALEGEIDDAKAVWKARMDAWKAEIDNLEQQVKDQGDEERARVEEHRKMSERAAEWDALATPETLQKLIELGRERLGDVEAPRTLLELFGEYRAQAEMDDAANDLLDRAVRTLARYEELLCQHYDRTPAAGEGDPSRTGMYPELLLTLLEDLVAWDENETEILDALALVTPQT
jgi:chromosome segregation ATPase